MVPSAAMGRDIAVTFMGGGPHAVYLLDAFDAAPDVSNWVTAGNAMKTLEGRGISVVAPAGGAYSMYTDWEHDGSKQWDTFLSPNSRTGWLPDKGLAPGGQQWWAPAGRFGRWRWPRFTPTGSATRAPCPGLAIHLKPLWAGRSWRAWNNSAAPTVTMWGCPATGPVEKARPLLARRAVRPQRHPHMDLQPRDVDRR